jgi:hypothetical protein
MRFWAITISVFAAVLVFCYGPLSLYIYVWESVLI